MTKLRSLLVILLSLLCIMISSNYLAAQESENGVVAPIAQLQIDTASSVAWSPDGTVLAVGDDQGITLFNLDFERIDFFEQPSEQMEALQWSLDGRYIAAASALNWRRSEVWVWDTHTGEVVTVFNQQRFLIPTLSWSPDSTRLATGAWDKTIKIWDALTGTVLNTFSSQDEVFSLSWSPDSDQLAAVIGTFTVFVWDIETENLVTSVIEEDLFESTPNVVAWSPDGQWLATDKKILDASTGEEQLVFENCPTFTLTMDWHPNSQWLAFYVEDRVVVCDAMTDQIIAQLEGMSVSSENERIFWTYLYGLDWHPDGESLAGIRGDGIVRIWRVPLSETETQD